jgi:hypothetical protein
MYNIVLKVLANWLKITLPDIILPAQSGFIVSGRLISGNILIAYELTHYMRNKRKGVGVYAAV